MKALPLWQPWASLVALGAKRVETRAWAAPMGIMSKVIAIHATKGVGPGREAGYRELVEREPFASALADADELPRGAIIAVAVVDRCTRITAHGAEVMFERHPREWEFGDYTPGRYAWVLRDVQPLPRPVPWKGSQRLFDVPELAELVAEAAQGALL